MGTKNLNSATDLITFTRASGGTALRKVGYGTELVTNGTFDTDITGWDTGNSSGDGVVGWSNGGATLTSAKNYSADKSSIRQVLNLPAGWYLFSFEAASTDTSFAWGIVGSSYGSGSISGAGWWPAGGNGVAEKLAYHAGGDVHFEIRVSGTTIIDNISVKQIVYDIATDPLVLYNHPNNTPRIEYNADGTTKGLLIEAARTNLVTYSEDFSNAYWSKLNITLTANDTTAPDGTSTASKAKANGVNPYDQVVLASKISLSGGVSYTYSTFLKAGNSTLSLINFYDSPTKNASLTIDWASGVPSENSSAVNGGTISGTSFEEVGDGWWRVSISFTPTSGTTYSVSIQPDRNTTGAFIYIWGAQLEAGATSSSYIPTSGSTATRAADVASIPTSDFGYNDGAGSVYVDGTFLNGDTIVTLGSTTITADADGNKKYTTTYSSTPSATEIALNQGTYSDFKYYPRRLSNAQLQELTT